MRNQEQRIAAIEERLGLNASNSSIPPSKQPPQAQEKNNRNSTDDVSAEALKDTKDLQDTYMSRVSAARLLTVNPRPASIAKPL
ncbi:DUF6444 domain-containing protein [Laspinema sp. D1]|nr:DUF6444 domain-containing protein [Laspinema sp. D2b]